MSVNADPGYLLRQVVKACIRHHPTYGRRRITALVRFEGFPDVSERYVREIMKEEK